MRGIHTKSGAWTSFKWGVRSKDFDVALPARPSPLGPVRSGRLFGQALQRDHSFGSVTPIDWPVGSRLGVPTKR